MKTVGVIPAHLASVRFPRKILFPFSGVPMIEHVRRRALLSVGLSDVVVATCDDEIEAAVKAGGGTVVRTGNHHRNGTSRVAEAVEQLDCTHVVLLQGDEPLLLPRHVDALTKAMAEHAEADAWNATGPIENAEELDRHSFVKCATTVDDRIMYCFRRSPSTADFATQQRYIRKILGLFGFSKDYLRQLALQPASNVEQFESIEQMRIIESGGTLMSVPVDTSLPSVNEPHEADMVLEHVLNDPDQRDLLARVVAR